jgi:hypothetical protein
MLLLPIPDTEGIAKTKQIVFNRTGHTPSDEEATRLLGGLMTYLYLLRRLDEQLQETRSSSLEKPDDPPASTEAISADTTSINTASTDNASINSN